MASDALPRMVRIRQRFARDQIADVAAEIQRGLEAAGLAARIRSGSRVAITAGSRGVARIPEILRAVARAVRTVGGEPFITAAMGSHGGATVAGQREILESYGITEAAVDAAVVVGTEAVRVGPIASGATAYMDRHAYEADATIVVGRVKAHTAFKGEIESGLCKMLAIGLGKQPGADEMHHHGLKDSIPQAAALLLKRTNVILGVAIVENAFDQPYRIAVVPPERFHETDRELLELSNSLLPRVPFDPLDVLVVDWMGKNISGTGIDYNIVGMWRRIGGEKRPLFQRIVVLNLTPESHGNAIGVGIADFTTRRLFQRIDFQKTYMNGLTGNAIDAIKIPVIMESDRDAISQAVRSANPVGLSRLARIHSTLHLEQLDVSEALLDEARDNPQVEILGDPRPFVFDEAGNLLGD